MKAKMLIPFLAGCGLCLAQISAQAQEFKTHISKQFTLQSAPAGTVVCIANLQGSVKVEGYSGNQVIMEIDETIKADNAADLETGKKNFKMDFDQKTDSVMAYIGEPYYTRPHKWNGWNGGDHHIDYSVTLEFVVKVPNNVNLRVSTVNNGDIDVKDVYGALKVTDVNGGIEIANAKGTSDVRTVNGPITVNYLSVPQDACSYNTVNGKVTVTYPKDLAADLQFKSMNGAFYTDFDNVEALPTSVTKTAEKKANGTLYKLNKNTQVKVGAGGKLFKFETLNGNIYIKRS